MLTTQQKLQLFLDEYILSHFPGWDLRHIPYELESIAAWIRSTTIESWLKFVLWVLLFYICAHYEFGLVYFVLSLFYGIFTVGLGQRKEGEMSAYSVFNKGVKSLPGQLKASQFEQELMHRY